jgi:endonuclease/exonuclease/phosphatase family metal-dependent hydrolase
LLKFFLVLAPLPALLCAGAPNDPQADLDKILTGDFTQGSAPATSLHIVDWNIDRGERLDQVTQVLERDQPDLCTFQEVDLSANRSGRINVAEELARRLKMRYAYASAWVELGQSGRGRNSSQEHATDDAFQGQAILTRLPMKNVRVIRFKEQSDFWRPRSYLPNWALFQRRLGGRIALVAELDFAGRTLVVYNPHLESRSGGRIQDLQMEEILADAKRYPEGTPIVIAGDFNTKYNAKSMSARLSADGWQSAFGSKTPKTHTIMFSLDWIVVHGPLRIEQGKVEHGSQGSDHLPISAAVSVTDAKEGPAKPDRAK